MKQTIVQIFLGLSVPFSIFLLSNVFNGKLGPYGMLALLLSLPPVLIAVAGLLSVSFVVLVIVAMVKIHQTHMLWWAFLPLVNAIILLIILLPAHMRGLKEIAQTEQRMQENQQFFINATRDFVCPSTNPEIIQFLTIKDNVLFEVYKDGSNSVGVTEIGHFEDKNVLKMAFVLGQRSRDEYSKNCKNSDGKTIFDLYTVVEGEG